MLDVRSATEIDELDITISVKNDILIFDVAVHNQSPRMEMMQCIRDLKEDISALNFIHCRFHLNVIEKIHARQTMRNHFDVIVDVVFEKVGHLHDVTVPQLILSKIIQDVDL